MKFERLGDAAIPDCTNGSCSAAKNGPLPLPEELVYRSPKRYGMDLAQDQGLG